MTAIHPRITERTLQDAIVECARALGWTHVYHTWLAAHSTPGFPDLVLLRPPRLLVIECKTERGKVSEAQHDWLAAFTACGVEATIARPADWYDGTIEALLR